MAIGSRQSVGPWHVATLTVEAVNEMFRQIQEQIDILRGLTGENLTLTVANENTLTSGQLLKAKSATAVQPAVKNVDYVAPTGLATKLDLSAIATSGAVFKINNTTNTPTVTFTAGGTIHISAAPSGYLQLDDGNGITRYIPFWA